MCKHPSRQYAQALYTIAVHREEAYAGFFNGGSVTSHRDDVKILQLQLLRGIKVHRIAMCLTV